MIAYPLGGKSNYSFDLNNALFVECCYCWKWDTLTGVRFDVHEIIFSRGSIRGTDEGCMLAIMDERNCGWVHQDECHGMAEGGMGRLRAIMYLIRYEGYTHVREFIREMSLYSSYWFEMARDVDRAWELLNSATIVGMP